MAEAGVIPKNLIIEPSIDDGFPETPLLAQLGGWDPFLLGPLVDGLWSEPEIHGDLFERKDVVPRVPGRSPGPDSWVGPENSGGVVGAEQLFQIPLGR
jgi:hypothetical protein